MREACPTAWELLLSEVRAGQRRYVDTPPGERYAKVLAWQGEGDYTDPLTAERTLGDLLHPARPGRVTDVVNAVSREVGSDVAGWRVERALAMYGGMEREARHRPSPEG